MSSYEKLRFLLVDDHQFVRHVVTAMLNSLDIKRIVHAANGEEAIKTLTNGKARQGDGRMAESFMGRPEASSDLSVDTGEFDCIVADYNMGPINGLQLLKMIRTGDAGTRRDFPVIMLTGHNDEDVVTAALELDVNAYIQKPVSKNEFVSKIERIMAVSHPIKPASHYRHVEVPDADGSMSLD